MTKGTFEIRCIKCGFLGIRKYWKNAKKLLEKHHNDYSDGSWPWNGHCGIINTIAFGIPRIVGYEN